jgi:hypothetical protein
VFAPTVHATNTIVAGNKADGAEQDCALLDSGTSTSSHNIQGDTTCGFSDSGSKTTAAISLGTLRNNGGPTDTAVPASTSPAVDAGTNFGCPATDERGLIRPQGSTCDIGAVELAPPLAVTGAATSITPTGAALAGTAGNPALIAGTATIQYGKTMSYGLTAAAGTVAAGASNTSQSAVVSGLTPNTTYHYRLSVTTTDGTATGVDRTFKTPFAPTSLSLLCVPASVSAKGKTSVCTATVANASGFMSPPTGSVKFTSTARGGSFGGSGACDVAPIPNSASSKCSVTYGATVAGFRTLHAAYGGDLEHSASSGKRNLRVSEQICGPPSGTLSGHRLGPVKLGDTRARTRKLFVRFSERGRKNMDFFCLSGGRAGIRVGYLGGRAVLALTANRHYHLGQVRPGDSLAKAERTLHIWAHVAVGLNTWYFITGGASDGIMKVRHRQVQEVGIASHRRHHTHADALSLIESFPVSVMSAPD